MKLYPAPKARAGNHLAVLCLVLFLSLVFTAARAHAGSHKRPGLKLKGGYVSSADIEGDKGSFSAKSAHARLSYSYFTLAYSLESYSFSHVDEIPFSNGREEPFEELHKIGLRARFDDEIKKGWGYFLGAGAVSAFEEDPSGSPGASVSGGLTYAASPDLTIHFGALAAHHKVKTAVLPLAGLAYKNPAARGFSAVMGFPESRVAYRFSERLSVRLALGVEGGVYRLADDGRVVADDGTVLDNGYLGTRNLNLGLHLDYSPIKRLGLSLGAGYSFLRKFYLFDSHGKKKKDYDVGDAPLAFVALNIGF